MMLPIVPRSITTRLVVSYCLLLVLLGGVFLAATVFLFQLFSFETVENSLAVRNHEVWSSSQGLLEQPKELRHMIHRRFSLEAQNRFVRIRAGDKMLYRSGQPWGRDYDAAQVPRLDPRARARTTAFGNLLFVSRAFHDARLGRVIVDTGQSLRPMWQAEARLAKSLAVGLPLLLIVASLAGYALLRRALTPVDVMIDAAETYTFDPRRRLPLVGAEPRIAALGQALNRLLDRIDNAYGHVSRFSADAAQELRRPLSVIRGELELIASGGRKPAEVDHAIANALAEMTRLSGVVETLITLSRMESLWGKCDHAAVDLVALAAEAAAQMRPGAQAKGVALTVSGASPVVVAGDRERLKQAMIALLENAIRHTGAGGEVAIHAGSADGMGHLTVEDTGIGIDPAHHAHVFEPFYRVAPERSGDGAGLGLSIVRSICQAHGGEVWLTSVPGIGTDVRIELPLMTVRAAAEQEIAG